MATAAPEAPAALLRVLIVEDDPITIETIRDHLISRADGSIPKYARQELRDVTWRLQNLI
jgi:hypothetical protein